MKKALIVLCSLSIIVLSSIIIGCEPIDDEKPKRPEKKGETLVAPAAPLDAGYVATDWTDVDQQIEWVAWGMALLADNNSSFKTTIHDAIKAQPNDDETLVMQGLEDEAFDILGIAMQNDHEDEIDVKYASNSYDRTFLPGFELYDDGYINFVYIPDAATVDNTLQHVVVPRMSNSETAASMKGYYIDANGNVAHINLDRDEPPTDQYYIWVVSYYNTEIDGGTTVSTGQYESTCGDGVCDYDEDYTCVDCPQPGNPVPLEDDVWEIWVKDVQIHEDEHDYMESWVSGKYEIIGYAAVIDANDDLVGTNPNVKDFTEDKKTYARHCFHEEVPRNRVCRKKGGNLKNCPGAVQGVNAMIVDKFNANFRLIFSFQELDYKRKNVDMYFGFEHSSNADYGYGSLDEFAFPVPSQRDNSWYPGPGLSFNAATAFSLPLGYPTHADHQNQGYERMDFPSFAIIELSDFNGSTELVVDNGEMLVTLELRPI